MSLNVNEYYKAPSKQKITNKGVLKNIADAAKKKPPVKMKNVNKNK